MAGWIKLHRKFFDWEWYYDQKVTRLFIHCLLKANHTEKQWQGMTIHRGEFVTSLDKLSKETGLSKQETRTCVQKLEKSQNLTHTATNKYTIIKVDKYELYQDKEEQEQHTQQQTSNKRTTNEQQQLKNYKNEKNLKKNTYGEMNNVLLTDDEFEKLKSRLNGKSADYIDQLSLHLESKGKTYKSHYATILTWWRRNEAPKINDDDRVMTSSGVRYHKSFCVQKDGKWVYKGDL